MPGGEIIDELSAMYAEMNDKFKAIDGANTYGYKIFNSPPNFRAPVMFIGYQPGGGVPDWAHEKSRQSHLTWPPVVEYAEAQWALAKRVKKIFKESVELRETVGLNAIFMRAPNVSEYKSAISLNNRKEITKFSNNKVCRIIELLQPKKIIAIGFSTLRLFGDTKPETNSPSGRALTHIGEINGREALASIHLTGARITNQDFERLSERLIEYVSH